MDDERSLRAGDRLDRYELLAPIASGGMASVWLAKLRGKRGFEKLFAIKTIKTDLIDDPRFQEMFLDEARIASGIQHPNVAQILDLGERDDLLYIVMEWVDGDSLSHVRRHALKEGKALPLDFVLRVIADACAGLHAAHELKDESGANLGVVHRDVSPHNVIVSSAGSVKVIDFGVAKASNRRAGETASGVIKGKVRYMAPEQVQGRAVDRRADIWAVGVCLHQLVTGELPFDDESDIDVIRRLMGDEPAPRPHGAVAEAIEEILAHSLVRDPAERFATAAAMQRAIEAAIDELGLRSTNEDIASFLRTAVPDLEKKRRDTVTKALEAARGRDAGAASELAPKPTADDAALAATVVQTASGARTGVAAAARDAPAADETSRTALVPKPARRAAKRSKKARPEARTRDESKATLAGAAIADEPSPPKGGRALRVVLALVAVALGAWFGWPGGPRIVAWLSPERIPEPREASAPERKAPARSAIDARTPPPTRPTAVPTSATTAVAPVIAASAAASLPSAKASAPDASAPPASSSRRKRRPPSSPEAPGPAPPPEEPDESPYN